MFSCLLKEVILMSCIMVNELLVEVWIGILVKGSDTWLLLGRSVMDWIKKWIALRSSCSLIILPSWTSGIRGVSLFITLSKAIPSHVMGLVTSHMDITGFLLSTRTSLSN